MFSPDTLKYVGHVSQLGSRMGFIPYKCKRNYYRSEGKGEQGEEGHFGILLKRKTGLYWMLWKMFVIFGVFFCLFKGIILVCYFQTTMASGLKKGLELFMVVAFSFGMTFHLNTVLFGDEVEAMFNYVINLNRRLSKSRTSLTL